MSASDSTDNSLHDLLANDSRPLLTPERLRMEAKGASPEVREALERRDRHYAMLLLERDVEEGQRSIFNLITLGELYNHVGKHEEAEALLREALEMTGGNAKTWQNLAHCLLEQEKIDEAYKVLGRAWKISSEEERNAIMPMLMSCLQMLDRPGELAEVLKHHVEQKDQPTAEDWFQIGQFYDQCGNPALAKPCYEKSIEIEPTAPALCCLGLNMREARKISEGLDLIYQAIERAPENFSFRQQAAVSRMMLGDIEGGLEDFEKALALSGPDQKANSYSVRMFYRHYRSHFTRQEFYEEAVEFGKLIKTDFMRTRHDNAPEPNRRLRIGYISPDFRRHSVSYFVESVLDGRNPAAVENFAYMTQHKTDDVTERLRGKFDHFTHVKGWSVSKLEKQIVDDEIDILVDLVGHTSNHRMDVIARKPAPVIVTWCGYPDTSGNPGTDYRITDALADPPEAEQWHTEELAYMPDCFLCYRPPLHAPAVGPAPMLDNGYVTFGSFNNAMKMTPLVRGLWAQVLQGVPDSKLLLKCGGGSEEIFQTRILEDFERVGIGADRIEFLSQVNSPLDHLDTYNRIDIALDSYPYNGTTTTCESLWMGVPVITLCGDVHCSRVGYSLLSNCDMDFFVAHDPQEYVNKAIALAGNVEAIQNIRRTMRQRLAASPLCNAAEFAHNLELLYRSMWHRWCESQGVEVTEETPAELVTTHRDRLEAAQIEENKDKPTLRLLHNISRYGGKLISSCLQSMAETVVLHEIHPQGTNHANPIDQACQYGLLTEEDIKAFREEDLKFNFPQAMEYVRMRAEKAGKTLIVRDWAHLDFVAVPFLPIPSNRLGLRDMLIRDFNLRSLCLVRHPLDAYLSLRRLPIMQRNLSAEFFLHGARRYAEIAGEIGFVRFEDFIDNPDDILKKICEHLEMSFDATYMERWHDYRYAETDACMTRGTNIGCIEKLPRPPFEPELLETFRANDDYHAILDLLDYADADIPAEARA